MQLWGRRLRQVTVAIAVVSLAFAGGTIAGNLADDRRGDGGDRGRPAAVTTAQPATSAAPGPEVPATSAPATTAPGAPAVEDLRLDLRGLGPVRVGMTVAEASAALGRRLHALGVGGERCELYAPDAGPDGVAFMVAGGTVARVDVIAGPVPTVEGLALGQTVAEAQRRYGGRLAVSRHRSLPDGSYLTLVPPDPADAPFRLVAETDGKVVIALRAGRLPEVGFPTGCS